MERSETITARQNTTDAETSLPTVGENTTAINLVENIGLLTKVTDVATILNVNPESPVVGKSVEQIAAVIIRDPELETRDNGEPDPERLFEIACRAVMVQLLDRVGGLADKRSIATLTEQLAQSKENVEYYKVRQDPNLVFQYDELDQLILDNEKLNNFVTILEQRIVRFIENIKNEQQKNTDKDMVIAGKDLIIAKQAARIAVLESEVVDPKEAKSPSRLAVARRAKKAGSFVVRVAGKIIPGVS